MKRLLPELDIRQDIKRQQYFDGTATLSFSTLANASYPDIDLVRKEVRKLDCLSELILTWDERLPEPAKHAIESFLENQDPSSWLEEGTQRIVFDNGNTVLKLAKNFAGLKANWRELEYSGRVSNDVRYASTFSTEHGLMVIEMEKVDDPVIANGNLGETERQTGIVGGETVCFDFGKEDVEHEDDNEALMAIDAWVETLSAT